jgi:hypothetical protein
LTMQEIFFSCGQITLWAISKEYFEGAITFLTPKLSRVQRGTI